MERDRFNKAIEGLKMVRMTPDEKRAVYGRVMSHVRLTEGQRSKSSIEYYLGLSWVRHILVACVLVIVFGVGSALALVGRDSVSVPVVREKVVPSYRATTAVARIVRDEQIPVILPPASTTPVVVPNVPRIHRSDDEGGYERETEGD